MNRPTIEQRLRRRLVLMSRDEAMEAAVRARMPAGWELRRVTELEALGDWHEILLYRFLILDLDEIDAFDPLDVIRELRVVHQINLPVFCFGGDAALQDEMRLARADRLLDRDALLELLPALFERYGWGGPG